MRKLIAAAFLFGAAGAAHAQARCNDGTILRDAFACERHGGLEARAAGPDDLVLQLPAYPTLSCEDGTTTTETGADACRGHGGLGAPQRRAPSRANDFTPGEPSD